MGRIALKVLSIYVVTSLIAISVGYLTYQIHEGFHQGYYF